MSVSFDFTGKKALVTGASRGIGCAIVAALSKAGANVVALARNKEGLEDLRMKHSNITVLVCDVTSPEATLSVLLAPYQPFDILVNNAGIGLLESCCSLTEEAVTK
ncbi:3-oxoacyl-[acyl-carrier-protein] reductase domain protein [Ancylostoma caninum]|uniref:3-oxoacyl-[acyl-carrier-protein] reductase domain protein n=1 Tax=Ancylostoma caninum TaxID=29170 RepID=A0A368FF34_ANCCA|nr:3-oxoacyl-[acyl-carrier-protein] reductase domain protein [Ancylostoma caninum]